MGAAAERCTEAPPLLVACALAWFGLHDAGERDRFSVPRGRGPDSRVEIDRPSTQGLDEGGGT